MESILSACLRSPVPLTYLGIGSCPHKKGLLEAKYDQLFPNCFHKSVFQEKLPIRIVHFDPLFASMKEYLDQYFEALYCAPFHIQGAMGWKSDLVEVIIVPACIHHTEHIWFFESLTDIILETNTQLVIQEFTGYSTKDLNTHLYQSSTKKEKYKRNILMDMTFETDSGCCTDMSIAQPFYDYQGKFLNLYFMNTQEVIRWIGISEKFDTMVKTLFKSHFLQTLNDIHVDYRRVKNGDPPFFRSELYNETTPCDMIMKVLQEKLLEQFDVLLYGSAVTTKEKENLQKLFKTYKSYDPYKWYNEVKKVVSK